MKQFLNSNIRFAKPVDMAKLLDALESEFICKMRANVGLTHIDVESETFEDYMMLKAQIGILYRIDLLDDEEFQKIGNEAFKMRLEFLAEHGVEVKDGEDRKN